MPTTVKVTRRSRNVGFGWTNAVEQTPSGLVVADFDEPDTVGTPRQCMEEYLHAAEINSGNDWRPVWFVGGRRVVAANGSAIGISSAFCDLVEFPDMCDDIDVELEHPEV